MKFYLVSDDDATEGEIAFATKREALANAKDFASLGQWSRVTKVTVKKAPLREMLVNVFNRDGYAEKYEVIEEFPPE